VKYNYSIFAPARFVFGVV